MTKYLDVSFCSYSCIWSQKYNVFWPNLTCTESLADHSFVFCLFTHLLCFINFPMQKLCVLWRWLQHRLAGLISGLPSPLIGNKRAKTCTKLCVFCLKKVAYTLDFIAIRTFFWLSNFSLYRFLASALQSAWLTLSNLLQTSMSLCESCMTDCHLVLDLFFNIIST